MIRTRAHSECSLTACESNSSSARKYPRVFTRMMGPRKRPGRFRVIASSSSSGMPQPPRKATAACAPASAEPQGGFAVLGVRAPLEAQCAHTDRPGADSGPTVT